jgi:hypothetical protein
MAVTIYCSGPLNVGWSDGGGKVRKISIGGIGVQVIMRSRRRSECSKCVADSSLSCVHRDLTDCGQQTARLSSLEYCSFKTWDEQQKDRRTTTRLMCDMGVFFEVAEWPRVVNLGNEQSDLIAAGTTF